MRVTNTTATPPLSATLDSQTAAASVLASADNVALVVQEGGEPVEAIAAALDEAGVDTAAELAQVAIVEIPPPAGADPDTTMFVVLWGRAARSLTWLDLPLPTPTPTSALRPEVMAGVLTAGNMAFGVTDPGDSAPYPSLARWLAVASPARAAWDALDRFFLAKKEAT